ncbi:MAG: ABC transporter permease [Chloroflexi bacterium]|nr:ABC transporter permease [Chloroflexota bacterium]MCL5075347.1 ABC transporter permease [Chloroflexota bacterium]
MGSRIWPIIRKEFIQIVRDRRTLAIILIMPVMMLTLLGYAVITDVKHIATLVCDEALSRESRSLIQSFVNTQYFDLVGYIRSPEEARRAIDRGWAKVAFLIPPDFSANLMAGKPAQVQVLIDGSDPNTAQTALFAASSIAQAEAADILASTTNRIGGQQLKTPIDLRPTVLYNPNMESANFMIPGLIGLILQFQTVFLTAFAIVREREQGTIEQLIVSPIKPWELVLGKILPYVIIAFWNVALTITVGSLWFKVEFSGSIFLLLALAMVFLLGSLSLGMLISTVSETQYQAMQVAIFYMMPSILLSGFIFPREVMPQPLFYLGYLIPLTYFLKILRGIALKGIGIDYLWTEVWLLAIFGLVVFVISISRFRKRLV